MISFSTLITHAESLTAWEEEKMLKKQMVEVNSY